MYSGGGKAQVHPQSGRRGAERTVSWQKSGLARGGCHGQWSGLARGGVGLRCQWQEKPSSAKSPVGTSCPRGTDPEPSIVRPQPCRGQHTRAAHLPTIARRTHKVSPVPRSTWEGGRKGEKKTVSECTVSFPSLYQN